MDETKVIGADRAFKRRVKKIVVKRIRNPSDFTPEEIKQAIEKALETFTILDWAIGVLNSSYLCGKCGICCRKCHPIRLEPEDIQAIANYLHVSIPRFYLEYVDIYKDHFILKGTRPCRFLRGNLCSIYPVRPLVCRFYPFNQDTRKIVFQTGCRIPEKFVAYKAAVLLIRKKMPRHMDHALELYMKRLHHKFEQDFGGNQEKIAIAIVTHFMEQMSKPHKRGVLVKNDVVA